MDLRNEVRRDIWDDPNWGLGDGSDLYKAYQLPGLNTRVVPNTDDYDLLSTAWSGEEHRVVLGQSTSIAGYWEGQPGWVRFESWPYTEVCVLVDGHIAVEHDDGTLEHFHSGAAFVIPAGIASIWHAIGSTRKYFVGVSQIPTAGPFQDLPRPRPPTRAWESASFEPNGDLDPVSVARDVDGQVATNECIVAGLRKSTNFKGVKGNGDRAAPVLGIRAGGVFASPR
jgi:uncharacterized protein